MEHFIPLDKPRLSLSFAPSVAKDSFGKCTFAFYAVSLKFHSVNFAKNIALSHALGYALFSLGRKDTFLRNGKNCCRTWTNSWSNFFVWTNWCLCFCVLGSFKQQQQQKTKKKHFHEIWFKFSAKIDDLCKSEVMLQSNLNPVWNYLFSCVSVKKCYEDEKIKYFNISKILSCV